MRQLPNIITLLRILLVVPITLELLRHRLGATLVLLAAAAASDAADGFLAKRCGWQSALGAVLDPGADKLLLATVFATLAYLALVPVWLVAAVLARDLVIVLGAAAFRYRFGPFLMHPTTISKLNTLFQVLFVLAVIGREQFGVAAASSVTALGALVFVTVVVSGLDYVLNYGRRALRMARAGVPALRADNGVKPS